MSDIATIRREINALFETAWLANPTSSPVPLVFANVKGSAPPTGVDADRRALPWARMSIIHLSGGDETLGPPGQKRYLYRGVVRLEIYTPIGDGSQFGDALAQVARAILRGNATVSGGWFTSVTSRDMGVDRAWDRQDVMADLTYEDR